MKLISEWVCLMKVLLGAEAQTTKVYYNNYLVTVVLLQDYNHSYTNQDNG